MNRGLRARLYDRVVARQLDSVEVVLAERVADSAYREMHHRYLLSPRSKRLRPLLLLLAGRFGRRPQEGALVRAAAALEMVHEGTLYHDDIVDDSESRRGVACAAAIYGAAPAARAGSELFYIAAQLSADLPLPLRREVGKAAQLVCHGQLAEFALLDNYRVSIQVREQVMMQKTASLFILAAELGAGLSGASESTRRRLVCFATRFGFAYQLLDDLRDVAGSTRELGRQPGSDLRDGVPTLPILEALRSSRGVASPVDSVPENNRADDLIWLLDSPALAATVDRLGNINKQLNAIVASCISTHGEMAKRDLTTLADMLVTHCPRVLMRGSTHAASVRSCSVGGSARS